MSVLTVRVSDDELNLIQNYAKANKMSVSSLLRDAALDVIESDLNLDEERILDALERSRHEKQYDHTEVWKMLGV